MHVVDLSPLLVLAGGALSGALLGLSATRLCELLPARYDITHLASPGARGKRNVGVVAIVVSVGLWLAHVVTLSPTASLGQAVFYVATNLVLTAMLVAAAAVDLEHMILPNELTLGGAALALATANWRGVGIIGALIGGVVGLGLTYLPFVLYKKLRGRSGMGLGDAKLALVAGLWLGAPGAFFVVFAAAVQSALFALILRLLRIEMKVPESVQAELRELRAQAAAGDEDARAELADDPMAADVGDAALLTTRLPMGPALVLGCVEFLCFREWILGVLDRLLSSS